MKCIGLARMFDWGERPNCKSHAMTSSKIFEKKEFLWDKDIAKWRIRSRGLSWHGSWILPMGKDLTTSKKISKIVQIGRRGEQTRLTSSAKVELLYPKFLKMVVLECHRLRLGPILHS